MSSATTLLRTALTGNASAFSAVEELLAFLIACGICVALLMYTARLDKASKMASAKVKAAELSQPLQPKMNNQKAAVDQEVSMLLRSGHVADAACLLVQTDATLDIASYKPALFAAARAGEQQACLQLLESMRSRGLAADAVVYNSAMTAAAKCGSVATCEMVFRMMESATPPVEPNAVIYATLIHACAKSSRLQKAEQYYEEMCSRGIHGDRILYNTLIHAAARAGDISKAESFLSRMAGHRAETGNSELRANVVTYTALITAAARTNNVQKALLFLDRMRDDGITVDRIALNAVLHLAARIGDEALAMRIFKQMEDGGAEVSPDGAAYRSLLRLWTEKKNQKKAAETMTTMRRLNFSVDRLLRDRAAAAFPGLPASTWWV